VVGELSNTLFDELDKRLYINVSSLYDWLVSVQLQRYLEKWHFKMTSLSNNAAISDCMWKSSSIQKMTQLG